MSHKTMIDGVAYEIDGGKTLIDGTAYSIDKGKTLVGGTAYEVGFATDPVITIKRHSTITGTNSTYAKVTINGVVYDGSQEVTLILPIGTIIACYVGSSMASYKVYDKDGNVKDQNELFVAGTYNYEVVGNATVEVGAKNQQYVGWQAGIIITET